jgi:hypothetical protein
MLQGAGQGLPEQVWGVPVIGFGAQEAVLGGTGKLALQNEQ